MIRINLLAVGPKARKAKPQWDVRAEALLGVGVLTVILAGCWWYSVSLDEELDAKMAEKQGKEKQVTLLKEQGWTVDVAPGGRTGLQSTKQRRYDLIISDVKMPDGDGQTFFRAVKAHDPELARRFVFITGDTANAESWAFLEDSHVPVIEKPFPPAVFEEAVVRVTSGGALPPSPGSSSASAASS